MESELGRHLSKGSDSSLNSGPVCVPPTSLLRPGRNAVHTNQAKSTNPVLQRPVSTIQCSVRISFATTTVQILIFPQLVHVWSAVPHRHSRCSL